MGSSVASADNSRTIARAAQDKDMPFWRGSAGLNGGVRARRSVLDRRVHDVTDRSRK